MPTPHKSSKTGIVTLILALLSICSMPASAQTDSATFKMQTMMLKIIQQAPNDFKTLKGAEVSRNDKAVFYAADLTKTITDANEMRQALASNLFGAMLTAEDNIIETGGSTIYLARYDDAVVLDVLEKAFLDMPKFLGADYQAAVEELKLPTAVTTHSYVLTIKGINIAKLDYDGPNGKGMVIIGIKK